MAKEKGQKDCLMFLVLLLMASVIEISNTMMKWT
jgi:hypothetical protein